MDFLNDKKNAPILIVIAVLALGGAVGSCVHFLSGPPAPPPLVAPTGQVVIRPGYSMAPGAAPAGLIQTGHVASPP